MEMSLMSMLSVASTAMSALGAMQQSNSQSAAYKSQQQAAEYNARVMEQNAANERAAANQREEAKRREVRRFMGAQRAAFAQAGIGLAGSAADVMAQSATDAELDALTLRYEGDMRARGMLAQAEAEKYQGRVAGYNAKQSKTQGYMGAIGSILGGAGNYMSYQENKRLRTESLNRIS